MTTVPLDVAIAQLEADIEREERGEEIADEAARLTTSFREFVYAAWPHLGYPQLIKPTWHIDSLADHIQAAYERDITRLVVTIQPGAFKSTILSVLAPAWRWTHKPGERFITCSHHERLATRDTAASRRLMRSTWYQQRWGHVFQFSPGEDMKTEYNNTLGGKRVIAAVGGGTGDRGTILQVDDPHNAKEQHYPDTALAEATKWWSETAISRLDDTVANPGTIVVIGQRIHQKDLIGFLLDSGPGRWTHLCLPTRWKPNHEHRYPPVAKVGTGRKKRKLKGDPRETDGELLMPKYQDEAKLADRVAEDGVTAQVFAGQYQQLPAPAEGNLLKRAGWRYYDRENSFYAARRTFTPQLVRELTSAGQLPPFSRIVCSWDTSVKDRAHSDMVSGQAWGQRQDRPADRWLLRLWWQRAGLNETIDGMLQLHRWAEEHWPWLPVFSVIERSANGPESIATIRAKVQGVIPYPEKGALGSKQERAAAASPALEGGNCFLPGYGNEAMDNYDPRTPKQVQEFVEELAAFDTGDHDDQVDAWSCAINYTRPSGGAARVHKPKSRRKPRPRALPA